MLTASDAEIYFDLEFAFGFLGRVEVDWGVGLAATLDEVGFDLLDDDVNT